MKKLNASNCDALCERQNPGLTRVQAIILFTLLALLVAWLKDRLKQWIYGFLIYTDFIDYI